MAWDRAARFLVPVQSAAAREELYCRHLERTTEKKRNSQSRRAYRRMYVTETLFHGSETVKRLPTAFENGRAAPIWFSATCPATRLPRRVQPGEVCRRRVLKQSGEKFVDWP